MARRNYERAVDLVRWCKGQEKHVDPEYVERVYAAAITAHLDAKDDTIDRLMATLDDQGYPRGERM